MGSRNGHAPIYMWYTLTLKGYEGMRRDVEKCLRNAHLLQVCTVVFSCLRLIIGIACVRHLCRAAGGDAVSRYP
jgi:hypothetical protein